MPYYTAAFNCYYSSPYHKNQNCSSSLIFGTTLHNHEVDIIEKQLMTQESPLWPTAYCFRAVIKKKEWTEASTTVKVSLFSNLFFWGCKPWRFYLHAWEAKKKGGWSEFTLNLLTYLLANLFKTRSKVLRSKACWVKIALEIVNKCK